MDEVYDSSLNSVCIEKGDGEFEGSRGSLSSYLGVRKSTLPEEMKLDGQAVWSSHPGLAIMKFM